MTALLHLRLAVVAAALALGGCAVAPAPDFSQYGRFGNIGADYELQLASESLEQLKTVYPAASTRLNVRQTTPDAYGVSLIAGLRNNGYAVSEYAGAAPARGTERPEQMTRDQRADAGVELKYIVDHPDPDLYRVTLFVGTQSISRAYTTDRGKLRPAGGWVRREF